MRSRESVVIPTAIPSQSARVALFELQVEQHHHDENYHREIARLPLHQRLNHMALHFAKYAGKIAAASGEVHVVASLTDTLIIALSSANILNTELWEHLPAEGRDHANLPALGRMLAERNASVFDDADRLIREFVMASGKVAAACEKIDHLEPILFRAEIMTGVAKLAELSLSVLAQCGIDPRARVHERLLAVKTRSRLHGRM